MTVHDINGFFRHADEVESRLPGSGEPPTIDPMEERVSRLEALTEKTSERLYAIEQDLAVMKSNYCTREDMQKEFGSLTWKLIGIVVVAQLLPALPAFLRGVHLIQ